MKLGLLGPVELVGGDGACIELASRRQRQLLVVLGLHRDQLVRVAKIGELMWGPDRPADPVATVQTNVSRLRRHLCDPLSVETEPGGYRFVCPDDHIDVARFEALRTELRRVAVDDVPGVAADALALWRGDPLGDLHHPDVEVARQRLSNLRLEIQETLADALADLHRHTEAIPIVEQLVRDHPYRERPVATLMRSMYASGRQADALAAFTDLRARLGEDLGVTPTAALRELELAILRQDLDPATSPLSPTRSSSSATTATHSRPSLPSIGQRIHICTARDGTKLAYAVSGSGPPLVKAANWMTHLDYDWESPVWRHWNEGLSTNHTLVRYDERGCGLSDREVDRFTFDAWVDDLASVVDAMDLDRFPLLGISQGGAVAIAYAVRNPERVSHLILWGAYGRGRLVRAVTEDQRREADLHLELAKVGWGTGDPTFRQVFTSQFMPGGSRDQWEAFNELQRRTCSADNAVRFMEVFASIDVIDEAPLVACPTLIMHARDELRVPFTTAQELAAIIPNSELISLHSRNHILMEDEPAWPRFLENLEDFVGEPA